MALPSKVQFAITFFGGSAVAACYVILRRRRRVLRATVTQLVVYPVKSCRGIQLEKAELDVGGIVHDREWMIVRAAPPSAQDAPAEMLTIREYPRMATIQPMFTSSGQLMLCTDDGKSICAHDNHGEECKSVVWRTEVTGIDQGDAVSAFLTAFLDCPDKPVRLIRMQPAGRKLMDCSKYNPIVSDDIDQGGSSRFSDWSQLSIISNQSLEWLNRQEAVSESMSNMRFRMNIVVEAAEPFAEDVWHTFTIGEVHCKFLKRCGRCLVPTVDPSAGTKNQSLEPLRTLKRLRAGKYPFLGAGSGIEAFLGVNMQHVYKPGQCIRVGDRIVAVKQTVSW